MTTSTQMLKGILEGCLLSIISEGEIYGYEMTKKLAHYGFDQISEGSIYPILLRMQKEQLVTTVTKASATGPKGNTIRSHKRENKRSQSLLTAGMSFQKM